MFTLVYYDNLVTNGHNVLFILYMTTPYMWGVRGTKGILGVLQHPSAILCLATALLGAHRTLGHHDQINGAL